MGWNRLSRMAIFLKDMVFYPSKGIYNAVENVYDVLALFSGTFIIILIKSFFYSRQKITYFGFKAFNNILSFLSIPQVSILASTIGYVLFIYLIYLSCRIMHGKSKYVQLLISMMSLAGLGLPLQILMPAMHTILPDSIVAITRLFIYLWITILSIRAISISQNISLLRAAFCFSIGIMPFLITAWFQALAPYLIYL